MKFGYFISLLVAITKADITIIPSGNAVPKIYTGQKSAKSAHDLLTSTASSIIRNKDVKIVLSSLSWLNTTSSIRSSADSFVRGAIEAWAQHQHLVIKPQDVWFSILVQMNFYMAAHADDPDVRSTFVAHQGKQVIRVTGTSLRSIIPQFQHEIQKRVKTAWLLDWIRPTFSTASEDDGLVANALMMGLMQGYFEYVANIICGIPSVTLAGSEDDWVKLERKLEHLPKFGGEPAAYANNLRPILKRFVRTFQAPESPEVRKFWNEIVAANPQGGMCGASPYHVSGWINAFSHWDAKGQLIGQTGNGPQNLVVTLDNVSYPWRDIKTFPVGFATVPLRVEHDGIPAYNATILAGMVGKRISAGAPEGYSNALAKINARVQGQQDSHRLEPVSGWFMYREHESSNTQEFDQNAYQRRESWPKIEWGAGQTCPIDRQRRRQGSIPQPLV